MRQIANDFFPEKVVMTYGCTGSLTEEATVTNAPEQKRKQLKLSLNEILRLQVMMQDKEGVQLSLQLGADPSYSRNRISLLKLANAFRNEDIAEALQKFGARLEKRPTLTKK